MANLTSTTLSALRTELSTLSSVSSTQLSLNSTNIPLSVNVAGGVITLNLNSAGIQLPLTTIATFAHFGLSGYLPTGISLFSGNPTITEFKVVHSSSAIRFNYTGALPGQWEIIKDTLTIQNISVNIASRYEKISAKWLGSFSGNISGQTVIDGSVFNVIVHFRGPFAWELQVVPQDGNIVPGLASLAKMIGGDALQNSVESGLEALSIDSISIDDVRIGFDLATAKIRYASMRSHCTVAGVQMNLYTRLPDFEFGGTLAPGSSISIRALLNRYSGEADLFPNITITNLSFSAHPSAGTYTLGVSMDTEWTMSPGASTNLTFTHFNFDIEKAQSGITGGMSTTFELGGVSVFLSGGYLGSGGSWQLSGSTGTGQLIPIDDLISDLATKFGLSDQTIPQAIRTLSLKDLATSFNTQSRDFSFSGEADFTINGQNMGMVSRIDITHQQGRHGSKKLCRQAHSGHERPQGLRSDFQ